MPTNPEDDNGEGHVDGFDDSEEITSADLIEFEDKDGNEQVGVILVVIPHDGVDYAIVQPLDQVQAAEDDEEVEIDTYMFTVAAGVDGEEDFAPLEDEAIFDAVWQTFSELVDTGDEGDDEG